MGLVASAQTNKQKSSSASKGKGKAKGKTLKDKNLKQLFEVNNKMRDLTRRLTLMQKSRHEPKYLKNVISEYRASSVISKRLRQKIFFKFFNST